MTSESGIDPRARELIEGLDLRPHPEGGFYRETFRSASVVSADGDRTRAAATNIYFLLTRGAHSRWHAVQSDETWHLYEGSPIELLMAPPDACRVIRVVLGPALVSDGPSCVVPAGWWQAARTLGPYTLAGCVVSPGFDFADFRFLREQPDTLAQLMKADPSCAELT